MEGLTFLDQAEEVSAGTEHMSDGAEHPQGPVPPNVSDVLGQEVRGQEPTKLRVLYDRVAGWVGAGLAVVLRPRVAGPLIFGLGVLIILLLAYIYLFTPLTAARAQHNLLQQISANPAKTYELAQGKTPTEGSPVAILEIPSLHVVDAVVEGSDAQDLRSGPGHMPTTSMPGQPGNAVIAGRRATFGAPFGGIGSLKKGQLIKVVDGFGTYSYTVTRVVYAHGGRHDVVTQTKANRLTLVTAASGIFPQGRLAVLATLDGKPLPGTTKPKFHADQAELGLTGDSASGLLAVFWCLLFFALLSVAAWLLRHWDQPVVVYVLAVPVLLLVALFTCESIIGFLPATV
ncbi:MAG TPA: sortase [Acidimicrobiales bacterium]|nr:sortase [Acidimicrobiales bacterium]